MFVQTQMNADPIYFFRWEELTCFQLLLATILSNIWRPSRRYRCKHCTSWEMQNAYHAISCILLQADVSWGLSQWSLLYGWSTMIQLDEFMIYDLQGPPRIHPYLLSRISPKQFNPLESQDMIIVSWCSCTFSISSIEQQGPQQVLDALRFELMCENMQSVQEAFRGLKVHRQGWFLM